MIDLHLHLDGSLSKEDFIYLSKQEGVELGKEFPSNICVPDDCPSLEVYLERFALPGALLQSKAALKYATKSLVLRLDKLGLIYAEIRFAPQLHTLKGLSQLEVTKAVLEGLEEGLKEAKCIEANLLLCAMRHASEEVNMETIEVANSLKGTRVVGVDLAGAEKLHPSSYYSNIFNKAKEYGLNITIHAGEATGSDEIMMAIDNGAKRIGHGVHLSLDPISVKKVKDNEICFEFCPTSNLQTKSLSSYETVPLREFMSRGIDVTLNSDNMTVSNTDVIKEMSIMKKTFKLTKDEIYDIIETAINNSFTDVKTRHRLGDLLDQMIDSFYESL